MKWSKSGTFAIWIGATFINLVILALAYWYAENCSVIIDRFAYEIAKQECETAKLECKTTYQESVVFWEGTITQVNQTAILLRRDLDACRDQLQIHQNKN